MGEESLDAKGEGTTELLPDDCLEVWLPVVVVEAERSGVLERRLLAMFAVEWLTPGVSSTTAEDLSIVMEAIAVGSGARVEQSCQQSRT